MSENEKLASAPAAPEPAGQQGAVDVKPWRDRIDANGTYRHSGKLPNGGEFFDCFNAG
jgi:hypothetical protein